MGGREGVLKQEGLLCTLGNALTDGPKGSFGVGKPDKAGTRRAGNRESYTSRPLTAPVLWPQTDRGLRFRKPRVAAGYKPTQPTHTLQHRGQAQVAECTAANKQGGCKGRDWRADRGEADKQPSPHS